ncbi:MAG: hypothetical protein HY606_10570 [Planctomycetes bacterium]|nr:hypothetical protein [Planctomycetota bacterium]
MKKNKQKFSQDERELLRFKWKFLWRDPEYRKDAEGYRKAICKIEKDNPRNPFASFRFQEERRKYFLEKYQIPYPIEPAIVSEKVYVFNFFG